MNPSPTIEECFIQGSFIKESGRTAQRQLVQLSGDPVTVNSANKRIATIPRVNLEWSIPEDVLLDAYAIDMQLFGGGTQFYGTPNVEVNGTIQINDIIRTFKITTTQTAVQGGRIDLNYHGQGNGRAYSTNILTTSGFWGRLKKIKLTTDKAFTLSGGYFDYVGTQGAQIIIYYNTQFN